MESTRDMTTRGVSTPGIIERRYSRSHYLRMLGAASAATLAGCAGLQSNQTSLLSERSPLLLHPCTTDTCGGGGAGGVGSNDKFSVITNGNANVIVNSSGESVLSQATGATTLTAQSGSSNLQINMPPDPNTLDFAQVVALGNGISVSLVSATELSWTGSGNNSGTLSLVGNTFSVTTQGLTSSIGTLPATAMSTARRTEKVPLQPCWVAKGLLVVAVAGLVAATIAAGGELGLNPLADVGFYSAYIGVLAANFDVQSACG